MDGEMISWMEKAIGNSFNACCFFFSRYWPTYFGCIKKV